MLRKNLPDHLYSQQSQRKYSEIYLNKNMNNRHNKFTTQLMKETEDTDQKSYIHGLEELMSSKFAYCLRQFTDSM